MKALRLQDAARMAAKSGIRIEVTTDGFRVGAKTGRTWTQRYVAYDEVDLAGHNALAEAVHKVAKDLGS